MIYALKVNIFLLLSGVLFARAPQVASVDGTVSINAENITLGRLLEELDQAAAMHSVAPPELASQKVTIHLSGVPLRDAIRRIFEQMSVDYVFVEGRGITVTGASQAGPAEAAPGNVSTEAAPEGQEQESEMPAVPTGPAPRVTPTPFGPVVQAPEMPVLHLPPVPGEAPPPPFFAPQRLKPTPPAGAPNGPVENKLFGPISIYQNPGLPPPAPESRP